MGVSATSGDASARPAGKQPQAHVVWHDLECGTYSADLPLWRQLADTTVPAPGSAPILDVGAGTGRVSLDLLRRGHSMTALDVDPDLLGALRRRAGAGAIATVCADARELDLAEKDFALVLVPMQTLQLFGGSTQRRAFLARAHAHLRPGGLLACAIVTALEPFDVAAGDPPAPVERTRTGGMLFESRARSVRIAGQAIVIERERRIRAEHEHAKPPASVRDIVTLDRLESSRLRCEGTAAGFAAAGTLHVPATEDHVGSTVVVFRV